MQDLIALTREVSPSIVDCELTHLERTPIDLARARAQHDQYERALLTAGCVVHRLSSGADMPDSVFIEDIAVVLDEVAIIARPGAMSRRAEVPLVEQTLGGHRSLTHIEAPGTLDGGDVMTIGKSIYVGVSSRTNSEAIQQLRTIVSGFGFLVQPVNVNGCLHLKSAVTAAGTATVLINPAWAPLELFRQFEVIEVHPDEPHAANVVVAGDGLIFPAAFPRTRERLEARGLRVTTVDVTELAKAEGAVTCCSLIFKDVRNLK